MKFFRPQLMKWGDKKITDHNRSELSIDFERIGTDHRTANGTRRQYIIAEKRSFSCSWDDVPHRAVFTVDGFAGGRDMEEIYLKGEPFTLEITNGDKSVEQYQVVLTEFGRTIKKRGRYDFYSIDATMEEL